jgi:hypothetical protein
MAAACAEVGMLRASLHRFADVEGASDTVRSASAALESRGEEPPPISPLPPLAERPFWSVMIPIYNCREDYLSETLGSVLRQDPGAADMQIEVLDNCSTLGDPESATRFNEVKVGDKVSITYNNNVSARVKPPGEADVDTGSATSTDCDPPVVPAVRASVVRRMTRQCHSTLQHSLDPELTLRREATPPALVTGEVNLHGERPDTHSRPARGI